MVAAAVRSKSRFAVRDEENIHLGRAQTAHDLSSWRSAAKAYDTFAQETGSTDTLVALGDVLREADQPKLAYDAYMRRCELRPEDGTAVSRLACAALELGDGVTFRDAVRKAHRLGEEEREGETAAPALQDALASRPWPSGRRAGGKSPNSADNS